MSAHYFQAPTVLRPPLPQAELLPFLRSIRFMQSAVHTIRHARTAADLRLLAGDLSEFRSLLISAEDSLDFVPEPLRSNYQAHLRTLSFELRRAHYLLLQERSRLQSQLTTIHQQRG